jgi:uncharacterized membrane protein
MVLLIASFVLNLIPIIVLPMVYSNIPDTVPAFVDFTGRAVISIKKTYVTIFRLPLMGIIFSIVCLIMYSVKLSGVKQKYNRIVWSIAAFIGALKMGLTSIEICFSENIELVKYFRITVFILSGIGIFALVYGITKIYKNEIKMAEYRNGVHKTKGIIIGILLLAYILVTIIPVYKYAGIK